MDTIKNRFSSESVEVSSNPKVQELQQKIGTTKANQEYLRHISTQEGGRVHKRKRNTKKKTMKKSHKKKHKKKTRKHTKRHIRKSYKNKKIKTKK